MFWQNVLMAQETEEPQDEEIHILLGHNHDWKISTVMQKQVTNAQ